MRARRRCSVRPEYHGPATRAPVAGCRKERNPEGVLSIDDVVARAEVEGLAGDVLRTLKMISPRQEYPVAA